MTRRTKRVIECLRWFEVRPHIDNSLLNLWPLNMFVSKKVAYLHDNNCPRLLCWCARGRLCREYNVFMPVVCERFRLGFEKKTVRLNVPTFPTTQCLPMHLKHNDPFGQRNYMIGRPSWGRGNMI